MREGRSLDNHDLKASLTLPVAIAVGDRDKSMPFAELQATAANLPLGEYWLFEGAGHSISTDAVPEFNACLRDFVDRVTRH